MSEPERTRRLADQRSQRVFHLAARALDPGTVRLVAGEFGALALHVQFARQPRLQAFVGNVEGVLAEFDRVLDHLDFGVESAQIVIAVGHVGGHAEAHVLGVGLLLLGVGAGGLVVAAHAAEQVQLPVQVRRDTENVVSPRQGLAGEHGLTDGGGSSRHACTGQLPDAASAERALVGIMVAGAVTDRAAVELRVGIKIRRRHARAGAGFLDAGDGLAQILVVGDRRHLQLREVGIMEHLPPRAARVGVGRLGAFPPARSFRVLVLGRVGRLRRGRAGVVWPDGAAAQTKREQHSRRTSRDHPFGGRRFPQSSDHC